MTAELAVAHDLLMLQIDDRRGVTRLPQRLVPSRRFGESLSSVWRKEEPVFTIVARRFGSYHAARQASKPPPSLATAAFNPLSPVTVHGPV